MIYAGLFFLVSLLVTPLIELVLEVDRPLLVRGLEAAGFGIGMHYYGKWRGTWKKDWDRG